MRRLRAPALFAFAAYAAGCQASPVEAEAEESLMLQVASRSEIPTPDRPAVGQTDIYALPPLQELPPTPGMASMALPALPDLALPPAPQVSVAAPGALREAPPPLVDPAASPAAVDPATVQNVLDTVGSTRARFAAFADHVNSNARRLQHELKRQKSQLSDLRLEKQQLEASRERDKQEMWQTLDTLKKHTLVELAKLEEADEQLEVGNAHLESARASIASKLSNEKSRNEILSKTLQKMTALFSDPPAAAKPSAQEELISQGVLGASPGAPRIDAKEVDSPSAQDWEQWRKTFAGPAQAAQAQPVGVAAGA